MDWKEKLAKASTLFEEAKAILIDPEATAEDKAKVESMIADADKLRLEAAQLKGLLEKGAEMAVDLELKQDPDLEKGERKDTKPFAEWKDFLWAAHLASSPKYAHLPRDPRLQAFKEDPVDALEQKQMVESIGASGGFLMPTEFFAQLQAAVAEASIVRTRATKIRMRHRQVDIPVLDQTGTAAGRPHWFGGMVFAWGAEALEKELTVAEWRQISLVAHKLYGYTRASDELVDDSFISLSDFLAGPLGFAGGVAWMEDYAFLVGTGAGQPLGIITAVNAPTIVEPRNVAGIIGIDDLADMREHLLPSAQAEWVITQSAMSVMIQLAGPAGNPAYWWQPTGQDGVPERLLGLPVHWSEKMPALGQQGDILLADFRYYMIGDRQATTIESTKFDRWRFDQTSWRVVHRVDGQPWLSAPLTYQDGATTVSPFVILGGDAGS